MTTAVMHDEAVEWLERILNARKEMDAARKHYQELRGQAIAAKATFLELQRKWEMFASPEGENPLFEHLPKAAPVPAEPEVSDAARLLAKSRRKKG